MTQFKRLIGPREKTEFHRDNKTNKWGFLGVKFSKHGKKFQSYIRDAAGKKLYCGQASTAEEAARLYDIKAFELYGCDAVLNFPQESK